MNALYMNPSRQNRSSVSSRRAVWSTVTVCVLFVSCSPLLLIPVSVKEIKDYVLESEASFSEPVPAVLAGAGFSLKQLDFDLKRVELFADHGRIKAEAEDTAVYLQFDAVTPRLTRMRCKISTKKGLRYFSSEEELFKRIHTVLSEKPGPGLKDICRGMATAFIEPDIGSRVVAYFAREEEIAIDNDRQHPDWSRVMLGSGKTAYISKKNIEVKADIGKI